MAKRFVYLPVASYPYVKSVWGSFKWESGMALSQRKKSSVNLHNAIKNSGFASNILECSRAGDVELGYQLSAFNLPYYEDETIMVENIYQGSQVLKHKTTGEIKWLNDLYSVSAMEAKICPFIDHKDYEIIEFRLMDKDRVFEANPHFAFYNYIYMKSLHEFLTDITKEQLLSYDGFTDTMLRWYDGKVTPCQAHAVAMYVGMVKAGVIEDYMHDEKKFMSLFDSCREPKTTQLTL